MSLPSVIASAARQPRAAPAAMDCFVALLLAMTDSEMGGRVAKFAVLHCANYGIHPTWPIPNHHLKPANFRQFGASPLFPFNTVKFVKFGAP
jgi:hypothetical protein